MKQEFFMKHTNIVKILNYLKFVVEDNGMTQILKLKSIVKR